MADPPIRSDLQQVAGPVLVRWYAAELAAVGAVLHRDESVEFAISHSSGVLVLTNVHVVVQRRGQPTVAVSYRELAAVETGAGSVWSRIVLRIGTQLVELDGMTSAEVRQFAGTVRARSSELQTSPELAGRRTVDHRNVPAPRSAAAELFSEADGASRGDWFRGEPLGTARPAASGRSGTSVLGAAGMPVSSSSRRSLLQMTGVVDRGEQLASGPLQDVAGDRPIGSISDPGPGPGLGTFEIHALGPAGSGKTVFMAAMYEQLRIRRPGYMFSLRSDYTSSTRLNAVYNKICDVDAGWPGGTHVSTEWEFTACIQSAAGDFEPLRFRYLDYPGAILTSPRAAQEPSVQRNIQRMRNANALLILLDGQAVAALMEGDPSGQRYLSFDLTSSLEIAQQSRCPIHFVITKWDLLARRYTLDQVRAQLLSDYNFRDLVESRAQDTPAAIRLFPVSAVGSDYATLEASGSMRKLGGRPRPYNVDLPLFSVLPDFLTFAHAEVTAQQERLAAVAEPQPQGRLSATAQNVSAAVIHTAITRRFPLFALVPPSVAKRAVAFGDRLFSRRRKGAPVAAQATGELLAKRRAVDSELAALDLLMEQCAQVVAEFEAAEPASVLTGGLTAGP